MSLLDAFGDDASAFDGLSEEQNQAVVDALMLMMFADGEATDGQVSVFSGLLSELPSFHDKTEDDRATYAKRSIDLLEKMESPGGIDGYLRSVSDRLARPPIRALVLALAASIGCVEGAFSEAQLRLLGMMGDAFGVDVDHLNEVVTKLAAGASSDA